MGFGRRRRSPVRGGRRGTLLVLLALVTLLPPAPLIAAAQEPGEGTVPVGGIRLPEAVKALLGGSSWLAAEGLDPRIWAQTVQRDPVNGLDPSVVAALPGAAGPAAQAQPVPFRSPAPAFSRNLIVTRQVGLFPIQLEPHIAVNPDDPEHLVLGTIDYNFPGISTYVSFDGGETWEGPNVIRYFQEDLGAGGDPVVAFGRDGTVYVTQISLDFEEFRIGSLVSADVISTLVVARSEDEGLTWSDAIPAARSSIETAPQLDETGRERGLIRSSFLDKQWLAVGPDPADPDRDILHLSYTDFTFTYGILYADEVPFLTLGTLETTIRSVNSRDGGLAWGDPVDVSPTVLFEEGGEAAEEKAEQAEKLRGAEGTRAAQDDDGEGGGGTRQEEESGEGARRFVQGSQPAVLPDGRVAVAYYDSTNDGAGEGLATVMVATSADGGQSYGEPVQAGVFRDTRERLRTAFFRHGGLPALAAGPDGEIYVVTAGKPQEKPEDDSDIYLVRSLDGGQTWDPPKRLNGDDTPRAQFFPAIDVSPDGRVHAMWGDMRDDPDEVRYHIYYTESQDQGGTWGFSLPEQGLSFPDTRVTDFPSNSLRGFPGGRFIGDYFAIAAADEDVYLVWADSRLGEFGGPNQQIGFARRRAIAPPELFLNPAQGVAGRDVTIQGFRFQPNANIAIDVGGVPITNLRSDDEGEFTTNIYMPVTGEGPRNVTASDDTGNVATASFFTEFGFDSIAREMGELRDQLGPGQQAPAAGTPGAAPAAPAAPAATPVPLPEPPALDEAAD